MNVDAIGKNKIKIDLTDAEILLIFGGYEMIDYTNPHSKSALNMLLRQALPEYMLPLDCKRVLIEVVPTENGCSIYFTRTYPENAPKRFKLVSDMKIYTLVFDDSESMIKGIGELFKSRIIRISESRLFSYQKGYRLIIKTTKNISRMLLHIKEYCSQISKSHITAAETEEYGKIICSQNAVTRIGAAFSHTKAT